MVLPENLTLIMTVQKVMSIAHWVDCWLASTVNGFTTEALPQIMPDNAEIAVMYIRNLNYIGGNPVRD